MGAKWKDNLSPSIRRSLCALSKIHNGFQLIEVLVAGTEI
jgi:hypothetical protein